MSQPPPPSARLRVRLPAWADRRLHLVAAQRGVPVRVVLLQAIEEHVGHEEWLREVPDTNNAPPSEGT